MLDGGLLQVDEVSRTRSSGSSLQFNFLSSFLCLSSELIVSLNTVQEIFSASGFASMLDSDVNSLLDDSVADNLVNLNTNSSLGNVPDNTSLAMVKLVRHTLVDGTVGFNVNIFSNSEGC